MDNDYVEALQCAQAYLTFRKLTGLAGNQNSRRQFYRFLGATKDHPNFSKAWEEVRETELAKQRIGWLLGPNANTMLRAWEANNVKKG